MILPVKEAYDILRASPLFSGYNIFMYAVPQDFRKMDKLPLIRISEVSSYQSSFVSDKSGQQTVSIQVDVWHKSIKDINGIYISIDKLFEEHGYANVMGGTDMDPDFNNTLRLFKRYRSTKFI